MATDADRPSEAADVTPDGTALGRPVSRLPLLIMAAVVAMVGLVTAALIAGRSPAEYPDGSPEAALQAFAVAVLDGDQEAVVSLLTPSRRERCRAELDVGWSDDPQRAELVSIDSDADSATAIVAFRSVHDGDVFDDSSWDRSVDIVLERVDGAWLIDRAGWPWALQRCTNGGN